MKIENYNGNYHFNNKNIYDHYNLDKNLDDIYKKMFNTLYTEKIDINDEQFIGMIKSIDIFSDVIYHRCWIANIIPYWYTLLKSIIEKIHDGKKTLNILQIGVFEGMSLLYLIKIILVKFNVNITIIDNFSTEPYFNTRKNFDNNTKKLKFKLITDDSHTALLNLISENKKFDYVYYSGSRKPFIIYTDLALLVKITQKNTCILVDDYTQYASYENNISPNVVRNTFLQAFIKIIEIKDIGKQKLLIFKEPDNEKYEIIQKKSDCINYKFEYKKYKDKYKDNKKINYKN